jgi:radical SAM superfamily enzyme YgiQ (UPF0313 family)
MAKKEEPYLGFEQGPIRPPSEAYSLLIRLTRNCPWNKCEFCSVYKGSKFSIRSVDHVIEDIELIHKYVELIRGLADENGNIFREDLLKLSKEAEPNEVNSFNASLNWLSNGMQSVFLQDANSLVMKPDRLIQILTHIRRRFPWVERITSYARSHSLARIKDENLLKIREAGLNRIHVGLESGSDKINKLVKKGTTKEIHIQGGRNVKKAGIELSEYIMPGLGGKRLSELNALETADALNQIDADFIRLRTLTIAEDFPLFGENPDVPFERPTDLEMVKEIRQTIDNIEGISSTLKSDHMMNLLQTVEGKFPEDKQLMLDIIDEFLDLDPQHQVYFQVGRRFGFMNQTSDLKRSNLLEKCQEICQQLNITPENADQVIEAHVRRSL